MIHVSIRNQELRATIGGEERCFAVSTALNGAGEQQDSGCTPRGRHRVAEKIGDGAPIGSVFVGRKPTGEIYDEELAARSPERDWILSRILWLDGCEPGRNQGGEVDSKSRYIYIHGTNECEQLGTPVSHGCIRMANEDVLTLFDAIQEGDQVQIDE